MIRQGHNLVIGSIDIHQDLGTANTATELTVRTAPNTWITHNAWVKGRAMWDQMNDEVLDDQPSIQGKWADFKVYLLEAMSSSNTLVCRDGNGGVWPTIGDEWAYSQFAIPNHDASLDPTMPAQLAVAALCGADDKTGVTWRMSLTNAYEMSRATVSDDQPNVPVGTGDSFFSQLMDLGGQETELTDIIVNANDFPPYANTDGDYPGGRTQAGAGLVLQGKAITDQFNPSATIGSFLAPCGLLQISSTVTADETPANFKIFVNLVPGPARGVMAEPMGQ